MSRDYANFYERAKAEGWLSSPDWTGIGVVDGLLLDMLRLLTLYFLGVLIWQFSRRAISVRFATGYFYYINAWSLLGSLFTVFFILTGFVIPWYHTSVPTLVNLGVQLAFTFMMLVFPIAFWPKLQELQRPVAYQRPADNDHRPLASRLIGVDQPVIGTQNGFSAPHPTQLAYI